MAAGIENDWKVKIKELDEIEKKIGTALQFAGFFYFLILSLD